MERLLSIGAFMVFAGILSILLPFIGYNLKILFWIDLWGPTVAWLIRGGLIVLGCILVFIGKKSGK